MYLNNFILIFFLIGFVLYFYKYFSPLLKKYNPGLLIDNQLEDDEMVDRDLEEIDAELVNLE